MSLCARFTAFESPGSRALRGFTLVELLVTIAVAAILTMIAAPAMQTMLATRAVAGNADDLAAALRQARSEALKRGMPVSVCASADPNAGAAACADGVWTAGWLVFTDPGADGSLDSGDSLVRAFTGSRSVESVVEDDDKAFTTFTANGLVVGGPRRWVVMPKLSSSDANSQRTVCLPVSGRAQVKTGGEAAC
ncbi:MAG TPA: GspH/FimT family pseudopilin [Ideonella sp.]|uniref:GspH/FimT family pseudopilin n=1 Tax=Ideonella sp. TaxID=1929293 RepID=UPI002CEF116B|nr:GspH/FimT family pseudopilin [Ideonella sp.]HSI49259.1 GspH/FimT family pseudopilin [Ideonella sp.]